MSGDAVSNRSCRNQRQHAIIKESVIQWYTPERWAAIYPYITGSVFSRRFIEHFITEYARAYKCEYPVMDPHTGDTKMFNVYHSAQTVLIGVHKRHMDPFGRRNRDVANDGRFMFGFGDQQCMVSVCSLIFFRWAYTNNVLQYAKDHENTIREDMRTITRIKRSKISVIDIEVPDHHKQITPQNPLQDEYWRASLEGCHQAPKKRRKRYRECSVDTLLTDKCVVTTSLQ